MELRALEPDQLNQMIADTLHAKVEKTVELSKLVYQKTGGNPFFTEEFSETLTPIGFYSLTPKRDYGIGI